MRRSVGVVIASAISFAAVATPIVLAVHFARNEVINSEFAQLLDYANDVLRRSEGTGRQSAIAFSKLKHDGLAPCSPAEIDLMREIAIDSSYLQAVGRTANGQIVCSSLGTQRPIPLGPVTYTSIYGTDLRTNVRLPLGKSEPVIVIELNGFASVVSPSLPIDVRTDRADVALGLFAPSSHQVISQRGQLKPQWLEAKGFESDFIDNGMLVTILRSRSGDLAAVASAPLVSLSEKMHQVLVLFIPLGLACGLALALAVAYLARARLSISSMLRRAARRDEFFLEYQPVVEMQTRRWVGAEALVRWRRDGEVVRPDSFIPIAEESGVITWITKWVLARVAADLPLILKLHPGFHIGINLSADDLQSDATMERFRVLIAKSGADPEILVAEATERGFLQGPKSREVVKGLRNLGVNVAMDDFGTGYSSLSYLERLAVNYLKMDKSFIETIGTDGATSHVVMHMIEMARALKLRTVAEGVETEEQAQFLVEHGVELGQGWLFAKPMALETLLAHLAAETETVTSPSE